MDSVFEETYATSSRSWHIPIKFFSDFEEDCLLESPISREIVLSYLRELKNEYLATENYNEVVFKN